MTGNAAERRSMRVWIGVAILCLAVLLAAVVPSPYAIERPGPVVDVLGEATIDERTGPVLEIDDAETYPSDGRLNLLSVTMTGTPENRVGWLALVPTLFDPTQQRVPLSTVYPSGITTEQRNQLNQQLMGSSQQLATAAALGALGEPVATRAVIAEVLEGGAAEGVLEPGDAVLRAGGAPVADVDDLKAALAASGAGAPVGLDIERGGERLTVEVTPREAEGGGDPLIGVTVGLDFDLPFEAEISLDEIGGPSAGMIFALAIYDRLTPGDLTGGLNVSGTGTVSVDGGVGAIGGIAQKLWGAQRAGSDLMLMPLSNCADLPERLPEGLPIVPVETLDEAIAEIEAAASGEPESRLERCGR